MRLTKIVTRKGDDGTTSLDGRHRISKDTARIEAIGEIDELNSVIGMVLTSEPAIIAIRNALLKVQQDLFDLGGELCLPDRPAITTDKILRLENWVNEWNNTLPPLKEFILPGGNLASATCHLARTVCRRAERRLVTLHSQDTLSADLLRYINRLSDMLFVAARVIAGTTSSEEAMWEHSKL
jgi:cob(I)alamin adenosyltransferase